MASVMRDLMNLFAEEAKSSGDDWDRRQIFDQAESYANNCHQMTSNEIESYLRTLFSSSINADPSCARHWEDAILILDLYFSH